MIHFNASTNSLKRLFNSSAFLILLLFVSCRQEAPFTRSVEDFNYNWKFALGDFNDAKDINYDDSQWESLRLPHDWSIEKGYTQELSGASTGFVQGGIGWYRKSFTLTENDKDKLISILFDGVYNNSSVWINDHFLGERPYGYSAFSYDLTNHLKFDGSPNVIAVKVNRTAYIDSRWYTGSGIYRNVQLVKTNPLHIKQWGVQITTPKVSSENAEVSISTKIENLSDQSLENGRVKYSIINTEGTIVTEKNINLENASKATSLIVNKPILWDIEAPNLYTLKTEIILNNKKVDEVTETFGIRTFKFDANKGFYLNGKNLKIKGVNLHHDAGAVGAAVPKAIWEYRVDQLKSIGVNAIRMAHNPHSSELMQVCDEKGILVMAEAFDEWFNSKGKSYKYLGDNAAPKEAAKSYPEYFNEWSERDLKDLIRRDFNHPSVIMWSIGNEIEWTFAHYSKTFNDANSDDVTGYDVEPNYDPETIKKAFEANIEGEDPLFKTAKQLVNWVKEVDTSRPTVCGSVLPSIGMASGYGKTVDIYGFNYRQADYDAAHRQYPNLKILGSENWGAYSEWKACIERDFVAGIFTWTGFAYLGEAGPWPRKGLEISFFDYAGFKTPRGHFFECLWKEDPKVYMATTSASESEFSFSEKEGWKFDIQYTAPPVWNKLRLWEWYKVNPKWKYTKNEPIIVQTYTNCEEAELFLNGTSLGKQKLADFSETDNIIKWLVPYESGELKVVGFNKGKIVDEYILNTTENEITKIDITSSEESLIANDYDATVITVKLLDKNGHLITDSDTEVTFNFSDNCRNLGIDNGWEMNVQSHKTNKIKTHNGQAIIILQSKKEKGVLKVSASTQDINSTSLQVTLK